MRDAPVVVRVRRGTSVESEHRGAWCFVGPEGVFSSGGDQTRRRFLRSAAKPFQAVAALERILAAGFDLDDDEIAVLAASHAGQPVHVGTIEKLLDRAGLSPSALGCGTHAPWHGPTAKALIREGTAPSVLHHNCAGKHTAMLLAARVSGESLDDYLAPEHPVQVRNRATLAAFAGCSVDAIGVDVDGCGAPTFSLALPAAARAFASLVDGSHASPALDRLRTAVFERPVTYCGDGRTCTRFLQLFGRDVWPKSGAEGFYGVAASRLRAGFAFKIEDGATRAVEPWVAATLLRRLNPDAELRAVLASMARPPVTNARGAVVGHIEADAV